MADAIVSQGSKIEVNANDDGSGAWLDVVGIQETPSLNISNTLQEITDLQATFREHKGTIPGGTLAFNVNWLPANTAHARLLTLLGNRNKCAFRMHFKDEVDPLTIYQFNAIVESVNRSTSVAGVQQMAVSLTLQSMPA